MFKLLVSGNKGTSVVSLTAADASTAMFPNADDLFSNCVENLSQYNWDNQYKKNKVLIAIHKLKQESINVWTCLTGEKY